jgi:pimeloyl-ACP methyl ester carboxylesterase
LDWVTPVEGRPTIGVGFEWLPASRKSTGTVVTVEGGPGYASSGSHQQYVAMIGPLRADHDVLVFDLRGTGLSTPVNCPGLQDFTGASSGPRFDSVVGACGRALDHTFRTADGGWAHASEEFTTANAARDLHDVLRHLALAKVDLYGDSYGSWFAQAFASRYPGELRSVTLDSTYPLLGPDPWLVEAHTIARDGFAAVCDRFPACPAEGGDGWRRIGVLAARLRVHPIVGTTVDLDAQRVRQTVDVRILVDLVVNAGVDPVVYSQLDAAVRAFLDRRDPAPLLRLAAWSVSYDNTNSPEATNYSRGLYFATACTDYPQLFDMRADRATRVHQYDTALDTEPVDTFAPFTPAEWARMSAYTTTYDACLDWPAPITRHDPPVTIGARLLPAGVPVLILSGDLDTSTPAGGSKDAARQLGSSARRVQIANLVHVTAMPNLVWPGIEDCGESLFRDFVRHPELLGSMNTDCASRSTPIALVTNFPRSLAEAPDAIPTAGNTANQGALRAAAVASMTVADAITRLDYLDQSSDRGLRGGSWHRSGTTTTQLTFLHDRWVSDAEADGIATWDQATGAVTARISVLYRTHHRAALTLSWNTNQTLTPVRVHGTAGRMTITATYPVS